MTNLDQAALKPLLFSLADDEVIIGHRNAEWTGHGPILEADIAFSSMAQDELGHAQAYYNLLHELGEPDPDHLAFLRPASAFRCAQLVELPRGDWAFSLIRQGLYDAAETVRLAALARSSFTPLAQAARKFVGEEKYHWLHARTWIGQLGRADDARRRLQSALDQVWPYALGLFEPGEAEGELVAQGVKPNEADLEQAWRELLAPVLAEAGLTRPAAAAPLYGGRHGQHTPHLAALLDDMQLVFRSEPEATW